ncbi:hypothetical protein CWC28_22020 [Pseudoalteromonas sp. S4492]|uniref:hypothetical protein n=1 Tax=Pseudoalteromonas sp. S4492 TaxID=579560 RepID=UPI00110B6B75|nr:hypothetical protein [Pseudoalteromonas sp. S4492]TMO20615.1 hypothetical protein CWC28_22020 [Pseudoalteromonas sp. S4492]
MKYPLFKQFINASNSLTRQQKNTLHRLLLEDGKYNRSRELEQTIEDCFAEQPHSCTAKVLRSAAGEFAMADSVIAVNIVRRLSMPSVAHRLPDSDTLRNALIIWTV